MKDPTNEPKLKKRKTPLATFVVGRRKALKLTQEQLAKVANISLDRIKSIETGRANPTKITQLKVLAKALETPLEEILEAVGIEIPETGNQPLETWEEPAKERTALAEFIVQRREDLNLNQLDLADMTGVPSGTVASIEAGHSGTPKSETLRKLAKGLRVTYEELDCVAQGLLYQPRKKVKEPLREFELYLLDHDKIPTEVAHSVMDMIRAVIRRYE